MERKQAGMRAETWLAELLLSEGWRILARNLRTPFGEIDILARDPRPAGSALVAVEVKARGPATWLPGEDAFRPGQRRRVARALEWSANHLRWRGPLRVDLATVDLRQGVPCHAERFEDVEIP